MEVVESLFCDLLQKLRLWLPRRAETHTLSRDFWMPDHSCRVCYECDSPFNIFNRRHHCRICGRIFCGRCTENTLPIVDGHLGFSEEGERVRVCNFCYRMKQEEKKKENDQVVVKPPTPPLTPSSSTFSLSSSTTNTSRSSTSSSSSSSSGNPVKTQSTYGFRSSTVDRIDPIAETSQQRIVHRGRRTQRSVSPKGRELSPNPYDFCSNRSDDDETDDQKEGGYQPVRILDLQSPEEEEDDSCVEIEIGVTSTYTYDGEKYILNTNDTDGENRDEDASLQIVNQPVERSLSKRSMMSSDEYDGPEESVDESKFYTTSIKPENTPNNMFDVENNLSVWLAPSREDGDDDMTLSLLDDDDDEDEEGGWGSSSNSDYRIRDKATASQEQRRAMRAVVDGHFRALVAALLEGEGLETENWIEIITALASQAASFIKPDMSKDGGMDPGGYVRVKCIASGHRHESCVVKGVVCKRNVAHRRMASRYKNPRLLLLGGSLEYQRVPNQLSSLDTLLQQEKEHLSMTVSRIEAHQPNVVLVEKTISRQAQEKLLEKDITFVLNVKKPLLEKISRCTGAEIVPAPDHLTKATAGHCDLFHVEKFEEDLGSAGQIGRKSTKTLMFFEGCPRPLGCTILLKGGNGDELQKVKRVAQFAVFAAYQLALETSFLVDEGANVPDLSLKSPISLTLPEKSSQSERSITTVPGFIFPGSSQYNPRSAQTTPSHNVNCFPDHSGWNNGHRRSSLIPCSVTSSCFSSRNNSPSTSPRSSDVQEMNVSGEVNGPAVSNLVHGSIYNSKCGLQNLTLDITAVKSSSATSNMLMVAQLNGFRGTQGMPKEDSRVGIIEGMVSKDAESGMVPDGQDANVEEFPPSPSDHQSILVSFTSSNLRTRTICEKGRLFRIKYYGSFDKPLGKFLRENVFDASKTCSYCSESREIHLHCYMHRQGSLTISVRRQNENLSGEREGKIWMWHRCLKCLRVNNVPPATARVPMSDAAWGLSFGKFLELSFSNHAAASRVASCGHSLHRDCLRFYGLGNMVACFRYAPINVHSVYLPPSKLEFNNHTLDDWLSEEVKKVTDNGRLFFLSAFNSLREIEEQVAIHGSGKAIEARRRIADFEALLKNDQDGFLETLNSAAPMRKESGCLFADILQLNATKRSIAALYYAWIKRFVTLNAALEIKKTSIFRSSTVGDTSTLLGSKDTHFSDKSARALDDNETDPTLSNNESEQVNSVDVQHCEVSVEEADSVARNFLGGDDEKVHAPKIRANDLAIPSNVEGYNHYDLATEGKSVLTVPKKTTGIEASSLSTLSVIDAEKTLYSKVEECLGEKPELCDNILEDELLVRRTLSEGQFPLLSSDLSYTFEVAWTGKLHTVEAHTVSISSTGQEISSNDSVGSFSAVDETATQPEVVPTGAVLDAVVASTPTSPNKPSTKINNYGDPVVTPFSILYRSYIKNFQYSSNDSPTPNLRSLYASFSDLVSQGRLSLPLGINDTVIIVYDDEPTSIIAYAITSHQYHAHLADESSDKDMLRQNSELSTESFLSHPLQPIETPPEQDEFIQMGLRGGNPQYSKATHVKVSFSDDEPQGKITFTVTCYYAKQFDSLRKTCCADPMEFIRSLCRCKKWGAQGGKSNVFFAKTQDDRLVIKQVTKTELESFIKFAPEYFRYLSESLKSGSPTCLAKILGIFQVTIKHAKGGKEVKMDLIAMENLLYGRHVNRLYDLKGSVRSRYNADKTGQNNVLLDQNLLETMSTHPIFIGNKAKRILERAVWNDTSFLASVDVMDYSLLVGVDEERQELVLGIIDFMRQYTWDKHLETWVKASGILGGPKNAQPTVISPKQYKKRFRKAMKSYFLMVPDQWSPTAGIYGPPHVDSVESFQSTA